MLAWSSACLCWLAGHAEDASAATRLFDKSYALVVGVERYADDKEWPTLEYGRKDALAMASFLEGQGYEVTTLLGEEATRENILWTLSSEIAPKLSGRDRVMMFFSGHGETREVGWRDYGYIIPYDATDRFPSWISMAEMREVSTQLLKARHQLFIFDSCYGGAIGCKARSPAGTDYPPRYIEKISGNRARQFITAGGKDEQVLAGGPHGYSYFTGYLLDALAGKADRDSDSYVTMSELSGFLLSAASNWDHTPRWGVLPEHEQGEFWFRVPGNKATAREVVLKVPDQVPHHVMKGRPAVGEPQRPDGLTHPQGPMDDLMAIKGIGERSQALLHEMGIFHYWQIAEWSPENLAWVGQTAPFKYVEKGEFNAWIEVAKHLMSTPER